ncbi:AB hydrolase-1 domain-containing protein [Aphelenchoides fujianensis]|nr:AB hydrolase-1 domain-containing protein [Aphelenchoides fujianensis]
MATLSKILADFADFFGLRALMRRLSFWALVGGFSLLTFLRLVWSRWKTSGPFFFVRPREKPAVLKGWSDGFVQLSARHPTALRGGRTEGRTDDAVRPRIPAVLVRIPECPFDHPPLSFRYCWRHQLREFQRDHHVVAVDMRGYGESERPKDVAAYRLGKLVGDLAETIEHFGGKVILVAHDWGAFVAWSLAEKHPHLVDRLVILNVPVPRAFHRLVATNRKQLRASWYIFMFQTPWLAEAVYRAKDFEVLAATFRKGVHNKGAINEEDLEAYKYAFKDPYALTAAINYYRAMPPLLQDVNTKEEVVIKPKTLIVWGRGDPALIEEGAHLSLQYCADARIRLVPNASHFVQEDQPDVVNAHIRDFLAEDDGKSALKSAL